MRYLLLFLWRKHNRLILHLNAVLVVWTILVFSIYYFPVGIGKSNIGRSINYESNRISEIDKISKISHKKKSSFTVSVAIQKIADSYLVPLQYIRPSAANQNIIVTEFWSRYDKLQTFIADVESQSIDVVELEIHETEVDSKNNAGMDIKKEPQQLHVRMGLVSHPTRGQSKVANIAELHHDKRDPFFFAMNEHPVVDLPNLDVKGIKVAQIGSDEKGEVMFGNQICYEGEICNGYLIKKIEKNQLFLEPENLKGTGRGVRYWYIDARKQSKIPSQPPTTQDPG